MQNRTLSALALAVSVLCLASCSSGTPEKVTETVTTTKTASSQSKTPSSPSESTTSTSSSSKATTTATSADSRPTGYTGAPTGDPTAINKTISHCATSSQGLYEQGTTWFTDGTSGWTQYCANNFYDGPPTNAAPAPAPENNEPSPWVQGQIDWANCLESGHTEEECSAMLN